MFPIIDGLRSIEFGTPGESRAKLIDFIVNGDKRATAGLLSDYIKEVEPVEHVGECLAMVDNDGKHVATLRVTRAEITRFVDVSDEFALAEAEGDLNADDFRASHLAYWSRVGETVTDDTKIVQVYFDLLSHHLRPLVDDDAEWIHRACQDIEIQRWTTIPRPYTTENAANFVTNKNGEFLVNAIVESRTNKPAGVVGIHHIKQEIATVGYWVAPWARQMGAASTALRILTYLASKTNEAQIVRATIAETNSASRATAERAGFKLACTSTEQCRDDENLVAGLHYEITVRR